MSTDLSTLTLLTGADHTPRYIAYENADGDLVYLARRFPWSPLLHAEDIDQDLIDRVWEHTMLQQPEVKEMLAQPYGANNFTVRNARAWLSYWTAYNMGRAFRRNLSAMVVDPESLEDPGEHYGFCARCHWAVHPEGEGVENLYPGASEGFACALCVTYVDSCTNDDCDARGFGMGTVASGESFCDTCRDEYFSYCDACGNYFPDEDMEDHDHYNSKCCESPVLSFAIRNDGEGLLVNDTRVNVSLPAGTISEEGINDIRRYLQYHVSYEAGSVVPTLGNEWQTRQGNFTKRLSREVWNKHKVKIPPSVLSQVGCLARDHSTAVEFDIEITRDLNLPPEEFANEDSCWWQSYSSGRCALKTNGGFAIRSFEGDYVTGRAWVMPLKKYRGRLTPTFRTQGAEAFVVFNCYEALSGYAPARLLAHMSGWTYRKLGNFYGSPMYINGNVGYLVAPEAIATNYTDGEVSFTLDQHSDLFEREAKTIETVPPASTDVTILTPTTEADAANDNEKVPANV